jgi:hypothetical protein
MGTVPFHRKNHKHKELCKNRQSSCKKNSRMMGGQFPFHFSRLNAFNKIKPDLKIIVPSATQAKRRVNI